MTVTRGLVIDSVRRLWAPYGFAALAMLVGSWLLAQATPESGAKLPDILRWSLIATWILAFLTMPALDAREISQLPIPRREMWIARWWLAVVVPPVAIAVGIGLGNLIGIASGDRASAGYVALLCALYGGCFMALRVLVPLKPLGEPGGMMRAVIYFLCIPVGGAVLPYRFAAYLPRHLDELNGFGGALLVTAMLATVASYFYRPPIAERASPPRLQSVGADSAKPSGVRAYMPGNLLTGLPRLFWVHAREIALMAPMAFVMIWFFEIATESGSSDSARHMLHRMQLMPFDVEYAFDGLRGFNVLIWVFVGVGFKVREIMLRARALRVLPMTARDLSLMFSGLCVVTASVIWIWLLGLHLAVVGSVPSTLRLDIFVIFCGALIIMRAAELAIPSRMASQFVGMAVFMPLVFFATFFVESPHAGMFAVGGACAVAGTAAQAWLLRRRHKIYKFKPQVFFGKELPS